MSGAVLRLVLAGSRSQWGRLLGITGGIAAGVLLILCLVAASNALQTRELRGSQLDPVGEQVIDLRDDTVLVLSTSERFHDLTIERVEIAATPDSAVEVPGIGPAPAPGTAVLSPALAALVADAPPAELGDRYGAVVGVLPPSVLTGPDALVAVVGADAEALSNPAVGALTVERFAPQLYGGVDAYRILAVVGAIALVVPATLLVTIATSLGAAARRERFATLRLIGGGPRLLTALVVVEAAATALAGGVVGVLAFLAMRPLLARLSLNGSAFYPDDLVVTPAAVAGVVLVVVIAASAAAALSIHRAGIGPLGAARAMHERQPGLVRLLPLPVGFALLAVGAFAPASLPVDGGTMLIAAFLAITIGLLLAGPRLTADASRLLVGRARSGAGLMAASRIRRTPSATFRAVSGVVIAVFAMSLFTGASSALVDGDDAVQGLAPEGSLVAWLAFEPIDEQQLAPIRAVAGVTGVALVRSGEEDSYLTRSEALLLHTPGATVPSSPIVRIQAQLLPSPDVFATAGSPFGATSPGEVTDLAALPVSSVVVLTDGSADAIERARTAITRSLPLGILGGAVTPAESLVSLDSALARDFAALGSAGIVIAAAIAAISLGVATTAAVLDRRRTIGLLRLIGMPRRSLRDVIALESAVPLLAVTALSIAAGYGAAAILIEGLSANRSVAAPGAAFFIAIGATLMFAVIAVVIAARTADRSTSGTVRFE